MLCTARLLTTLGSSQSHAAHGIISFLQPSSKKNHSASLVDDEEPSIQTRTNSRQTWYFPSERSQALQKNFNWTWRGTGRTETEVGSGAHIHIMATAALPSMASEKKVLEETEQKEETAAADGAPEVVPEIELKHNLQNTWKIWYFENMKDKQWEDCLRVVSPFHTVEDFWSVYNHIKSASDIRTGGSYYVFKDGIKPMWEDEGNRKGGRWLVSFNKGNRQNLDGLWLEVLLCLIGEAFDDDGDDVCGAVVDIRGKQDRISIWTADFKNRDRIMNIGRKIKERLSLGTGLMSYESHESTAVKTGSSVKSLFSM